MNLKEAEEKLRKTQGELEAELKSIPEAPEMGSDVDSFDTETDEAEEFSNTLGVKQTLKGRLLAVKAALERIEKGTYGVCEKCETRIPEEVLKVNPESELCNNCKAS